MRLGVASVVCVTLPLWLGGAACERRAPGRDRADPGPAPAASRPTQPSLPSNVQGSSDLRAPSPISSEARALARDIQASKLHLAPERLREPRLAFGDGVVAQLTSDELVVRRDTDFAVVLRRPFEGPRVVVPLADGSLLAAGARELLRFEPKNKRVTQLARLVLLPGAALFPDAIVADRAWIFDRGGGDSRPTQPTLSSLQLDPEARGILLPTQTLELESGGPGVLGATREGVWIHWAARRAQRFGPGGARLPALKLPELPKLLWALPARRLDQCYLFDEAGRVFRAVVSPTFRQLAGIQLQGQPLSADVGDEGRLLAVVVVTGAGPRFELQLFDADLKEVAKVPLPAEMPTGDDEWVRVVTENQGVTVASRRPLVALGGPARLLIVDGLGKQIFPIPSQ
jgi:hypothetical protein